jgi:hypothetical protein
MAYRNLEEQPMSDTKRQQYIITTIAIMFTLLLAGCVTDPYHKTGMDSNVFETERLLAEAGFQMKPADTPEKLAHLKTLAQWTVTPQVRDGNIHYAYADATYCECLYVGTAQAYHRYLNLAKEERTTRRRREAKKWYWYDRWGR